MKKNHIGERIKSLREPESRPSFASRFGISVATLARYEGGETSPNADFIMILCENYNVTPDWLIYGNHNKNQENNDVAPIVPEKDSGHTKKDVQARMERQLRI